MTSIIETTPLQANGASTKDWLGQVEGQVIYSFDISALTSEDTGTTQFTKEDFDQALKKVARKIKK